MTITLQRKPFSRAERDLIAEAIMIGASIEGLPELDTIATEIAEKLPDLIRKAGVRDSSDNRRRLIDLVLVRWAASRTPQITSYRKFARSGRFRMRGRP